MSSNEDKNLDYYLNLDWTLIEGTDLDFNGEPYFYIEVSVEGGGSAVGGGKNKKLAEQDAAAKLIAILEHKNG